MKLDQVVPWGRNLDEYRQMFCLADEDLEKSILGCGDGPASFNAELSAQAGKVTSVDPIYQFSRQAIAQRIDSLAPDILKQLEQTKQRYLWHSFNSVEHLGQVRLSAMKLFLEDFDKGLKEQRYLAAQLPNLPFADQQFDLALVSHLLFLYSEQLSLDFHKQSLIELCRVASEVRVYPLISLAGEKSPYLASLIAELTQDGIYARLKPVSYQFQRGACEMLVLRTTLCLPRAKCTAMPTTRT